MASFLRVRNSARLEGTAGVARWAGTYGDVVTYITIGVKTAGAIARVNTMLVHAALVAATLAVLETFNSDTLRQRVARVPRLAGTNWPDAAVSAVSADAARVGAARHRVVGYGPAMLV